MASLKQIEANRQNAQLSTGPRTPEGKAASSRNALKTGIYADKEVMLQTEDPAQLAALTDEYYHRWHPVTPEQRCLVDCLIFDEWQLRRFRRIQGEIMSSFQVDTLGPIHRANAMGTVFQVQTRDLDILLRRANAVRRSYEKTLQTIKQLKAEEIAEPAAETQPQTDTAPPNQSLPQPNRFVPSTFPEAPASTRRTTSGPTFPILSSKASPAYPDPK